MKVLIATKNPNKIEGATKAFKRYFANVELLGISTESGVPDEPVNEDIYIGAKTRIENLKKYAIKNNIDADMYISVESGISNMLGKWVILSVASIENKEGLISWGNSAGFPVPDKYVDEIINNDLGKLMDRLFHTNKIGSGKGGVAEITKQAITRSDLNEQAFIMALTQYVNEDLWR